jgi:hypothetical protein
MSRSLPAIDLPPPAKFVEVVVSGTGNPRDLSFSSDISVAEISSSSVRVQLETNSKFELKSMELPPLEPLS